jgi:hypothetical protein
MSTVKACRTATRFEQIRLNGTAVDGANLVAVQLDDMPILLDERREMKVNLDVGGEGAAMRHLSELCGGLGRTRFARSRQWRRGPPPAPSTSPCTCRAQQVSCRGRLPEVDHCSAVSHFHDSVVD